MQAHLDQEATTVGSASPRQAERTLSRLDWADLEEFKMIARALMLTMRAPTAVTALLIVLALPTYAEQATGAPTLDRGNWHATISELEKQADEQDKKAEALRQASEALEPKVVAAEALAGERAVISVAADWIMERLPAGYWVTLASLLVLVLLLWRRPHIILDLLRFDRALAAFKDQHGNGPIDRALLRKVLLGVVIALLLLNGGLAFAKQPSTQTYAAETLRYLNGDAGTRTTIRLQRLTRHPGQRLTVHALPGAPDYFPTPGRIKSGSFEHHASLAVRLFIEGDEAGANAEIDAALAASRPRKRDFAVWLLALLKYNFERAKPLAAASALKTLAETELKDVLSLVDLGRVAKQRDPEFAGRLLEVANTNAKQLDEVLLVFHYRKSQGLIVDPDAEWATLLSRVEATTSPNMLVKVFLSARYLKMQDIAKSSFDRLKSMALKASVAESLGQELQVSGHVEEAKTLLGMAIAKTSKAGDFHSLIAFTNGVGMNALRDQALSGAVNACRRFSEARSLLDLCAEQDLKLGDAFQRGLGLATRLSDTESLIAFAKERNDADLEKLARVESVGMLRSFKDMLPALREAIAAKTLDVAVMISAKINEKYATKWVPARLLPDTRLNEPFFDGTVHMGVVHAMLLHDTNQAAQAAASVESFLQDYYDYIIFDEVGRWGSGAMKRLINDLDVYDQLLKATGSEAASAAVTGVESLLLTAAGLTLPSPPGVDRKIAELHQKVAAGKEAVAQAKAAKIALDERLTAAEHQVATASRKLIKHVMFVSTVFLLLLLGFLLSASGGLQAAANAERYRTYTFLARFIELIGWCVCATIALAPIGFAAVLAGQGLGMLSSVQENTRLAAGGVRPADG